MSLRGQYEFQRGSIAHMPIETLSTSGGARVDVDGGGVPTVSGMWVNGTAVDPNSAAYALTITQEQNQTPAAITGLYDLEFDTSTFNRSDIVTIDVQATVGGITVNTLKDAIIVDDPAQRPAIC